jgi:YbbR domain-containing protein
MRASFAIRWITRDWPLKLVSLALALALWLLLVPAGKVSSEKSLTIPLETRNIPAGLEIVERPVSTIDVTVRAPSRVLSEIGPSSLVVRIDLERGTIHQQEYSLNASMIDLPAGAQVVKISPSKVTIRLEKTSEAILEVHATLQGKPASGFRIARVEIEPASVAVQGPESTVKAAEAATTAPVDVSGLTQSTVFDADIILPRPELRFVDPRTSARVTVVIEQGPGGPAPGARRKKEIAK